MKYGRYEVKKVEYIKSASEETECFNLDLFVDGKKFANIGNDGHGGSHRSHPYPPFKWQDIEDVTEQMKTDTFLVPADTEHEHFDTAVSSLFELHQTAKLITKAAKKKAVYLIDGDLGEMGYKSKTALPDQKLFEHIRTKHPTATILNGMDPVVAAKLVVESARVLLDAESAAEASAPGM